jgi:hypothetical protein
VTKAKVSKSNLWLKDLEPIEGAHPSSGGGATLIMNTERNYLVTNENDLDILVNFEEEKERRGHFTLIFPLKTNIDTYRQYF